MEIHKSYAHTGVYSVLTKLRKSYWIPSCFSFVKKCLRQCISCKRFNSRNVKLNQNSYRDFRLEPQEIPFRDIFIDNIGPFVVDFGGIKRKNYLLIITCLWSRAINLKVCSDMTVDQFLRALQLHVFSFGAPGRVYSHSGSNLVKGAKVVTEFFNDVQTRTFF